MKNIISYSIPYVMVLCSLFGIFVFVKKDKKRGIFQFAFPIILLVYESLFIIGNRPKDTLEHELDFFINKVLELNTQSIIILIGNIICIFLFLLVVKDILVIVKKDGER